MNQTVADSPEITGVTQTATAAPSTAGMTTKVVKGSLWTLLGQVLPLGVSLFTTPFVIRMLGAEGYGVLILVGLIPTYLGFADFGMSIASTKFASEAYAEGDPEKEARIVRTAALIAFAASLPFGIAIFALSGWIVTLFNVPEHLLAEAALALKFASVTFVVNFLNNIFNTPQLTRLRMDLNTLVTSGFRILGLIALPIIIYLGGGIIGAVFVLLIASVLTLLGHFVISARLLPNLVGVTVSRELFRPFLRLGGALVGAGIASVLLVNLEKVVLARTASVQVLAYYSLAFTLATVASMSSLVMIQSLIPAFSQLASPDKREQLQNLFSRSLRLMLVTFIPILGFCFVAAKPLFTFLGGEDFGRESTWPFRLLLFGLLFNIMAYAPYSLLMAFGRTELFAKLYWIELLPYIALIAFLTSRYGALGAAGAWTIRVIVDAIALNWLAVRSTGITLTAFNGKRLQMAVIALVFGPSMMFSAFFAQHYVLSLGVFLIGLLIYGAIIWKRFIEAAERVWLVSYLRSFSVR